MKYDVFISFKRNALDGSGLTREYELASNLHKVLTENEISTFFGERDLSTSAFRDEIDRALDEAQVLIVAGTSRENLEAQNVKYEWSSFHDDLLKGIKPTGEIYTYLENMSLAQLPRALRQRQSFQSDQTDELVHWVKRNFKRNLNMCNSSTDIDSQAEQTNLSNYNRHIRLNLHIGDVVTFGRYPQGANGEVRPIEWRVLDVREDKALLLKDKLLDCIRYNNEYEDVTWENCTQRKWMNNDFIQTAFSRDELSEITTAANDNRDNPEHGTKGGNTTQDKIFALSIDEAKKYFDTDSGRSAETTVFAERKGAYINNNDGNSVWWLRSPGHTGSYAAYVYHYGSISIDGNSVCYNNVAVRPALWIKLQ